MRSLAPNTTQFMEVRTINLNVGCLDLVGNTSSLRAHADGLGVRKGLQKWKAVLWFGVAPTMVLGDLVPAYLGTCTPTESLRLFGEIRTLKLFTQCGFLTHGSSFAPSNLFASLSLYAYTYLYMYTYVCNIALVYLLSISINKYMNR